MIYFYNFSGHPNTAPFWSASSHYTYINWDHPDEETDFYSETDVNGSWKLGDDLCKGLIFENKRAVQDALLHYCLRLNQTYKMSESKPEYFTAKCQKSVDGCPWRIRAHLSKKIGKWTISKWGGFAYVLKCDDFSRPQEDDVNLHVQLHSWYILLTYDYYFATHLQI